MYLYCTFINLKIFQKGLGASGQILFVLKRELPDVEDVKLIHSSDIKNKI